MLNTAPDTELPEPITTVAVRALCEFTAKQGDLDLRFTPSPSAQDGIAGHQVVASRRAAPYRSEVTVEGRFGGLRVRGRADGFHPGSATPGDAETQLGAVVFPRVEEVKTFRGDLARQPANHRHLHWAQAKVYGWLLCQAHGLQAIDVALVYFDIAQQTETVLVERHTAPALHAFFDDQCARYMHWAAQEAEHRTARDAALAGLAFPHGDFRTGQRPLAEAVFRAARTGRCLMAQAPTGIGKTVGTLFPLLKAAPAQRIDKVFFLTAKTSGRQIALDALARVRRAMDGQPLRVLELVARDKACEHPDLACHGDSCPLARGFYDRLPQARAAAVALAPVALAHAENAADGHDTEAICSALLLDKATVRAVALAHGVCPYYLAQDLVRWSDVAVGDYHYYFDAHAMLHALTVANDWQVAVLVDEAHNLIDRARSMYTATFDAECLRAARRAAPPAVVKTLARVRRAWNALVTGEAAGGTGYRVLPALPAQLLAALQHSTTAITDALAEQPVALSPDLQAFYFDALHITRLAESFGSHSIADLSPADDTGPARLLLCLRNIVPAPFLAPRFAAARTVVLFSATLTPWQFHADTLGLPADTAWIDVPSPFNAGQLTVQVARHISTRYADRKRSLAPMAALMAAQFAARPGNYLAFFSSFDYLNAAAAQLQAAHPEVPVRLQSRRMREADREAFLAGFAAGGSGIAFAVLGSAFAEGIDLPGDRLIGAFIATLGLPQVNPMNEQFRRCMEQAFGHGWDTTYLYPGLQKVVQAAGRVIRTPTDQGVVHLMDDRFARPEVQALLPAWWSVAS